MLQQNIIDRITETSLHDLFKSGSGFDPDRRGPLSRVISELATLMLAGMAAAPGDNNVLNTLRIRADQVLSGGLLPGENGEVVRRVAFSAFIAAAEKPQRCLFPHGAFFNPTHGERTVNNAGTICQDSRPADAGGKAGKEGETGGRRDFQQGAPKQPGRPAPSRR